MEYYILFLGWFQSVLLADRDWKSAEYKLDRHFAFERHAMPDTAGIELQEKTKTSACLKNNADSQGSLISAVIRSQASFNQDKGKYMKPRWVVSPYCL